MIDELQHMTALRSANVTRSARAKLKKEIFAGVCKVSEVLEVPCVQTMTAYDLLDSQQRWGHTRSLKLLKMCGISESRMIKDLTPRQKKELARLV